jgi:hypothetical protein
MSKRHVLIKALRRVGAFRVKHNREQNLTLGLHLMNTYDDLKRRGLDEEVALAGGLHSIYGTNAFKRATLGPEKRVVIRELFGDRAERLAWLFGHINRPKGLESGDVRDWKTGEPVEIADDDLRDLKLIEIANLIDNGAQLSKYPNLEQLLKEQ